jgi:hypothetical protein
MTIRSYIARPVPRYQYLLFFTAILVMFVSGCLPSGSQRQRSRPDDQLLFSQALEAFNARNYTEAVDKFLLYTDNFPESKGYTIALQRMGEAFEGILATEYTQKLVNGGDEKSVRQKFLSVYGRFKCWDETQSCLRYNMQNYKTILEKFPESPIADEAAYKLIVWHRDYNGRPDAVLDEIRSLKKILEEYPSTSLRHEILYRIARRFNILYEIYAFSPDAAINSSEKAVQYHDKAVYTYRLVLDAAGHSEYSHKAWKALEKLEKGEKLYRFP